jgi:hypothetical protein
MIANCVQPPSENVMDFTTGKLIVFGAGLGTNALQAPFPERTIVFARILIFM